MVKRILTLILILGTLLSIVPIASAEGKPSPQTNTVSFMNMWRWKAKNIP